ncbi:MAG: hypothetical protein AAF485_03545 [Chloroflexota bacterium]
MSQDQIIQIHNHKPPEKAAAPVLEAIIKPIAILVLFFIVVWPELVAALM